MRGFSINLRGRVKNFNLPKNQPLIPSFEAILDFHDFSQTPDKMEYYKYNDKMNAYIEILSYDKIINDAQKRNKILFDKLGI